MSNSLFVFSFLGAVITVFVGSITYLICDDIATYWGNFFASWPIFVAGSLAIISMVLWFVFAMPLFEPVCVNGHRNNMDADYCIVCGVDLVPSCDCGHVWNDDQSYCPVCGKPRQ